VTLLNLLRSAKAVAQRDGFTVIRRAKACFAPERTAGTKAQAALLPALEENCDDLLMLVDKGTSLPETYVPEDLVSLRSYGIPTLGRDMFLRREAAGHLAQLVAVAAAEGEELIVISAYRSFQYQQAIFERYILAYGDAADRAVARPGHSQHQLGTAVDFTSKEANYRLWQPFAETSAGRWLLEHAAEYGFVLSYPRDGEAETGYMWEPWHYRYIGTDNAQRMQASGMSLQTFLIREGVSPR